MNENYMPKVAKMLGVKIDEPFDIISSKCGEIKMPFCPYIFDGQTIRDCNGVEIIDFIISNLLKGKFSLQKHPWRPKNGEKYWYCSAQDGCVYWAIFCTGMTRDLAFLNMRNCFPTEEAAEAAKHRILEKFEEIYKEVRE